jgi:peptide subunit release factor 1 (eRF1)
LNLQPGDRGRDQFAAFLRKELDDRIATYGADGPERTSLLDDATKIREYVGTVDPSANGLALFSSSGADLFEAMPTAAPISEHEVFISDAPHLYPLARLIDEYPRYAVLLADTHSARIFVFAANAIEREDHIEGTKTKHHKKGGWSQARYQRHTENYHVHHAKEVIDALARIVRSESIGSIVIAGDEVIVPLIREQLPKDLAERIVDTVKLDMRARDRQVLDATVAVMREQDAESDREHVERLVGEYRRNGLGALGVEAVKKALELGQVDELVIAAQPQTLNAPERQEEASDASPERTAQQRTADELVVKARQTSAKIRFIEDPALLSGVGGVGALLRFKL